MSVLLESIDLTGLIRDDLFGLNVRAATQTSLIGSLIVYEQDMLYNDFNLIGGSDWGWLDLGTLNAVKNLANSFGATYTLDYEGSIYTVRFKTEDIPVISGEPLFKRGNSPDSDFYNNIVIKLMEV